MNLKTQKNKRRGIASLPIVLLVAGIIVELGIAGLAISITASKSSANAKYSNEALTTAQSGADDALLRIIRNKNCPIGLGCLASYTLPVGDVPATVTINKDTPAIGQHTVTSESTIRSQRRKVQIIVDSNSGSNGTGKVNVRSYKEVEI